MSKLKGRCTSNTLRGKKQGVDKQKEITNCKTHNGSPIAM